MQKALDSISVVLCNTSHAGNIGSSARAMKTMGIHKLVLVNPKVTVDATTIALASNAADVVSGARIVGSLATAIEGCALVIATTSRRREFNQHLTTPKGIVPEILEVITKQHLRVALVFGCERSGLTINELAQCNRLVTIPGNPEYFSLNLAQAVQILCYEIYSNYNPTLHDTVRLLKADDSGLNLADINACNLIANNLHEMAGLSGYKFKGNDELTRRRIHHIIDKAKPTQDEADLLLGMLKKISQQLGNQ